jgi:hypothetical protein
MNVQINILVIVLAIASVASIPSLISNQRVNATLVGNTFCDNGGSESWVDGCKQGWYDHDHCKKYNPNQGDRDYARGYKVGWDKGHCK